MVWPADTTSRAIAGNARTCAPITKNVAFMLWRSNSSSRAGVAAGFGPSSNVSAIALRYPVVRRQGPKICAPGYTAPHVATASPPNITSRAMATVLIGLFSHASDYPATFPLIQVPYFAMYLWYDTGIQNVRIRSQDSHMGARVQPCLAGSLDTCLLACLGRGEFPSRLRHRGHPDLCRIYL